MDLVQLDVVVTDKKGRHVTHLTIDDFEILQDKKPQTLTHARYVVAESNTATPHVPALPQARAPRPGDDLPPVSPRPMRADEVRRAIALLVDDYSLSMTGMFAAQAALKTLVRDEMREGDLLAVIRTRGGAGLLQQFTNDRHLLEAAIEDLRYMPNPPHPDAIDEAWAKRNVKLDEQYARDHGTVNARAVLAALHGTLESLRELPGRKSIVLLSESLSPLDGFGETDFDVVDRLRRVTDAANRASVVVYAVDPGGLRTFGVGAAESDSIQPVDRVMGRSIRLFQAQGGLSQLTSSTGGVFHPSSNRPASALREVLEDQRGYYLLGYEPDPATFARRKEPLFHNIKVRVKQPGLRVRTRAGFLGIADEEEGVRPTHADGLLRALASPLAANDLPVRLNALFGHDPEEGYVVQSFLHVGASHLTFRDTKVADKDLKAARVQVASAVLRDDGRSMEGTNGKLNITVTPERLETLRRAGLALQFRTALPEAGSYQFRIALRDAEGGHAGSATQFLYVPNLSKKRLALSGIVVGSTPELGATPVAGDADIDVKAIADSDASPAVRRFRPGTEISYAFAVYHPALHPKTGRPDLTTVLRVVHNREDVLRQPLNEARPIAPVAPVAAANRDKANKDKKNKKVQDVPGFVMAGGFQLPPTFAPGEYALQMIVTDRLAKDTRRATTSHWTEFEVVGRQ